jgi:hypothetical protein
MFSNPFKENSTSFHDYEILKDLEWHCSKCELKSGQAKTWQTWRDAHGFQFSKGNPNSGNWEKRMKCENCNMTTSHRKLEMLERHETTSARSGISSKLATKIKVLLKFEEAFWLRQLAGNLLEVDHKFPQIRWNIDEEDNENATDEELIAKFILLTRSNNLLKSRNCERCVKTNKRGNFPGIYFWYEGDENWQTESHDEKGCVGCFWYDPYKWREELNKIITNS